MEEKAPNPGAEAGQTMERAQAARFTLINLLHAIRDGEKPMPEKPGRGGGSARNVGDRGGGDPGAIGEGLPSAAAEKCRKWIPQAFGITERVDVVLWAIGGTWILWQLLA